MKRLAYIDWMRGLACVLMFQTHAYDSWMSPEAKKSSSLIAWSRLGGTLPAPLFIFLAGVSFALMTERLREKGIERGAIARQTIRRGAEIFGMGLLFRVQEFALGYPWSPWTDLLRVDVLNILGLSMMLMGVLCWATGDGAVAVARARTLVTGLFAAATVDHASPDVFAVAAGVLHQRRAHFQSAAALAFSLISLVGVRVCRPRRRLFSFHRCNQAQRRPDVRSVRRHRNPRGNSFRPF